MQSEGRSWDRSESGTSQALCNPCYQPGRFFWHIGWPAHGRWSCERSSTTLHIHLEGSGLGRIKPLEFQAGLRMRDDTKVSREILLFWTKKASHDQGNPKKCASGFALFFPLILSSLRLLYDRVSAFTVGARKTRLDFDGKNFQWVQQNMT